MTTSRPNEESTSRRAHDEPARMAAVQRFDILDSPPDGAFDRITALAARLLDVPVAIVSIVDTDRIWFKSHHGVDVQEVGRDPGLCASAILHDGPWIIEDASSDPRSLSNPLVAGDSGFGFYFGVPLQSSDGHNLGTLCVLDTLPRTVSDRDLANLSDLAAVVMDELELRMSAGRILSVEAEHRHQAEQLARTLQESLIPAVLPRMNGLQLAARYVPADKERVGGDFYEAFAADETSGVSIGGLFVGDVCGHGPSGAALAGMARHTLRAYATGDWSPAEVLTKVNNVMVNGQRGERRFCTLALARLDPTVGGVDVTISLGGHPHPFVIRKDGSVESIGVAGSVVGWSDTFDYQQTRLELGIGDSLMLFTDGLTDIGRSRQLFGNEQLVERLQTWPAGSAADLVEWVIAAVEEIDVQPDDDIAILVARVTA